MKKLFSFILLSAAMMVSGSAWATDAPEPLTFTNKDNKACILFIVDYAAGVDVLPNLEYKVGGDAWTAVSTWIPYQSIISISPIPMPANGQVQLRGNNEHGLALFASSLSQSAVPLCQFKFMGGTLQNLTTTDVSIEVSGNIMSLIDSTKEVALPDGDTSFELTIYHPTYKQNVKVYPYPRGFYEMFKECSNITDASKLKLPAEELENECYYSMFNGCTNLTKAPTISATTLAPNCCDGMFQGCRNMTDAPKLDATTLAKQCYSDMFRNCFKLTTAPVLPATILADSCYYQMFLNCEKLDNAPQLPATTLAAGCYDGMFKGCSSLTTAPDLTKVTTLAPYCFHGMFNGCGLTSVPTLPSAALVRGCYCAMFNACNNLSELPDNLLPYTTLASDCYESMFAFCEGLADVSNLKLPATTLADSCYLAMFESSNITTPPALPSTTLANSCYRGMFTNCYALTTAPVLPASKLSPYCYAYMFSGAKKGVLNYIKCMATDISAEGCTTSWVSGVASSGTFVKAAGATWPEGVSGIPSGWTQETVSILDDSKEYDYDKFKETSSLEMNRTFKHNGTNHTICLPFDLDEDAFANSPLGAGCTKLQTLGSAAIVDGTLEVTMVDVSTKAIEAGKPYLIAWENDGADVVCPTFEGVTFKSVSGGSIVKDDVTFHGLLGPQSVTVNDSSVLFIGATGNLNWPNAGSQINGYRCYFKVNTGSGSPIRRGMTALLTEGRTTPTGMNQVTGDRLQVTDVEKLIEQGKVVIISDGVRYDLQGNILK